MAKSQPSLLYPSLIFSGIVLFGGLSIYSVLRSPVQSPPPIDTAAKIAQVPLPIKQPVVPPSVKPEELAKLPPVIDYAKPVDADVVRPSASTPASSVVAKSSTLPVSEKIESRPINKGVKKPLSAPKSSGPVPDSFTVERRDVKLPVDFSYKAPVKESVTPPPVVAPNAPPSTPPLATNPLSASSAGPSTSIAVKSSADSSKSVYVEPLIGTPPSAVAANEAKAWIKVSRIKTIVVNKGDVFEGFGKYLGSDSKGANFEQGSIPFNSPSK